MDSGGFHWGCWGRGGSVVPLFYLRYLLVDAIMKHLKKGRLEEMIAARIGGEWNEAVGYDEHGLYLRGDGVGEG